MKMEKKRKDETQFRRRREEGIEKLLGLIQTSFQREPQTDMTGSDRMTGQERTEESKVLEMFKVKIAVSSRDIFHIFHPQTYVKNRHLHMLLHRLS